MPEKEKKISISAFLKSAYIYIIFLNVNTEDGYQYSYSEMYDELSSQIESNMYHCKTAISYNKLFYLSTTCKVNNNNAISESYTVSTHHFHIARDPVPTS